MFKTQILFLHFSLVWGAKLWIKCHSSVGLMSVLLNFGFPDFYMVWSGFFIVNSRPMSYYFTIVVKRNECLCCISAMERSWIGVLVVKWWFIYLNENFKFWEIKSYVYWKFRKQLERTYMCVWAMISVERTNYFFTK